MIARETTAGTRKIYCEGATCFYALDALESQAGDWVGLSDLTVLGNDEFLVAENSGETQLINLGAILN